MLAAAASLVDEIRVATEATGIRLAPYGALGLEWHLGNVFTKLGITSRKDLR